MVVFMMIPRDIVANNFALMATTAQQAIRFHRVFAWLAAFARGLSDVIASDSEAIQPFHREILDCFVAPAQNCFAILSRAPRNDERFFIVLPLQR